MATPTPSYFAPTGDGIIDGTTNGYRWSLNADRTIDWSLSNGFSGEYWSNPAGLQPFIGEILAEFSYYADVKFNYLGFYATPSAAADAGSEINVSLDANLLFSSSAIWGMAFFPNPAYAPGQAGDVFLNVNSQANFLTSYAMGSAGWFFAMHELGHALGLKHPHDDGGTGRPTLEEVGLNFLDTDWATMMSYDDDFNWNLRQWDPATPMVLDVLALQYLYGKNMATNAGDSLFALERMPFYGTYWDASGNDTVSAANQAEGWGIFLPNVQLSGIVDTQAGMAAPIADFALEAPHTLVWLTGDIENASGSNFDDVLEGSDAANRLTGLAGNDAIAGWGGDDVIDGGNGYDTAYFYSGISEYTVANTGGAVLVSHKPGTDGLDRLSGVERLEFADMTMDLSVNALAAAVPSATLQAIVELYVAFFNRVPDGSGMAFWLGQAAAGVSISSIANSFYGAAVHYADLTGYSATMSDGDFVNVIYRNVLGRSAADAGGLEFWSNALATGAQSRGTLVQSILNSAHTFKGQAEFGWVADLLDNKYAVGKLFSVDLGLGFNTPDESISEGMRIAAAVTPFDTGAAIGLIGVAPGDIHLA